jgi:hypothetical protein
MGAGSQPERHGQAYAEYSYENGSPAATLAS